MTFSRRKKNHKINLHPAVLNDISTLNFQVKIVETDLIMQIQKKIDHYWYHDMLVMQYCRNQTHILEHKNQFRK